jgi:hypothetical protein
MILGSGSSRIRREQTPSLRGPWRAYSRIQEIENLLGPSGKERRDIDTGQWEEERSSGQGSSCSRSSVL